MLIVTFLGPSKLFLHDMKLIRKNNGSDYETDIDLSEV